MRSGCLGGVALAAALAGCGPDRQAQELAKADLQVVMAEVSDQLPATATHWSPQSGRMDEVTRGRHGTSGPGVVLMAADVGQAGVASGASWRRIGSVTIRGMRLDGTDAVQVSGPPGSGLERDLDARRMAGRDLRLELMISARSPRQAATARGVRVSLACGAAGESREAVLPLTIDTSPGWEVHAWNLHLSPQLASARLRIMVDAPDGSLTVGGLRLIDTSAGVAASRPTGVRWNLLAGGDFESPRAPAAAIRVGRWADGREWLTPAAWSLEGDAAVGERCLQVRVDGSPVRLLLGPLQTAGASELHLAFHARASAPLTITAALRGPYLEPELLTFQASQTWQRFNAPLWSRRGSLAGAAELVLELASSDGQAVDCRLDGLVVSPEVQPEAFPLAGEAEVAVSIAGQLSDDLSPLIDARDQAVFEIHLQAATIAAQSQPAAGQRLNGMLALDLLDHRDRPLWSRTVQESLPPGISQVEQVRFRLPPGYYRLLASLWDGAPGSSRLISQDVCAIACLTPEVPVPLRNPFGLTAGGAVSLQTTALGAGWVRLDASAPAMNAGDKGWEMAPWQAMCETCAQASLELVAGLTLPAESSARQSFVNQWLAVKPMPLIGVVASPPAAASRPAEEYVAQLSWLGDALAESAPGASLVYDLAATGGAGRPSTQGNAVAGYVCVTAGLPESAEKLLSDLGRGRPPGQEVWDLGVPVDLAGPAGFGVSTMAPPPSAAPSSPVELLEVPPDPLRSGSRMIRAMLIRSLAGVRLTCAQAMALNPPPTLLARDPAALHEPDLSPRPALAAFERTARLLNDATLVRWVDVPGGIRILLYQKDDGAMVAAMWRAFGLAPSRLGFPELPTRIQVTDCFGGSEAPLIEGRTRVVQVDETVRFMVAGPEDAETLRACLDHLESPVPVLPERTGE